MRPEDDAVGRSLGQPANTGLVDRKEEHRALTRLVAENGARHLHLSGPHGCGKTLLSRTVLADLPDATAGCYVSCTTARTAYQVLTRLAEQLTGDDLNSGYHTAQLYTRVETHLDAQETVIVLDDVGFLLLNDADDLLYSLSRLTPAHPLRLVLVSIGDTVLARQLDARTRSSFRPDPVTLSPYRAEQVVQLLRHSLDTGDEKVTDAALAEIASTTANIRLGRHWLARALEVAGADTAVTADCVRRVEDDALHRYRRTLLEDFSRHHQIVLRAIEHLATAAAEVTSGQVYDRYETLCRYQQHDVLSRRSLSDFLKHLELLGLIDAEYHYGGTQGKTRHIRLCGLEEV